MKMDIANYEINEEPIYQGSNSIVFSGERESDQKSIVFKLLRKEFPTNAEIEQFKFEFHITQKIHSDKTVEAYSFEKYKKSYLIIMENGGCPSLAEVLSLIKKTDLETFLELAIKITEALREIHQYSVIHKDINPSNILCDIENKVVKIIDFGLSTILPIERASIVSPNVLEGTLAYISPEQTGRMNRGIDYRTDFYSLGMTFYQMLTGELPFKTDDPMELIHSHIAIIPKTPSEIDPYIPEMVSLIIMKLLAKAPEERYQNSNGLITDLKNCLNQLRETQKIQWFILGKEDIFSRFQIPEKLYGREIEVKILMDTYDKVATDGVQLMLIAGYSGIGKSSLVHEIYKPVVQKHGYFSQGKYDQYRHNIPYSALMQAFDDFVKQILTEPEEQVVYFRNIITKALGENAQIIADVVPSLVSIIGQQPPVAELDPKESQNRFENVVENFLSAISSKMHPLIIFLDDMQWADLPSLNMLQRLLNSKICQSLLIIGAYRNNEVSVSHPLNTMLDELKKQDIFYDTIDLGPLSLNHVEELIADTLHQSSEAVKPLADICYQKTKGNPFFLIQLITTLYKQQLIKFNIGKNQWEWDLDTIQNKQITDNVVDLMVENIYRLSPKAQETLKYAACIGNRFDINLLSSSTNKLSHGDLLSHIQESLKEGYIICYGRAYKADTYQFVHDRVQQAAYSLVNEEERKLIHLNIARFLVNNTSKEKLDEAVFTIVDHYNKIIELNSLNLMNNTERKKVAELNLRASKIAKSSAAFDSALDYAKYGIRCMPENAWKTEYDLTFELCLAVTETAYLCTEYDIMAKYAKTAIEHAKDMYDELKIISIQISSCISKSNTREAIDLLLVTLKKLGVSFPKPTPLNTLIMLLHLKFSLLGKKIPDLIMLPEMKNRKIIEAMKLISLTCDAAYISYPELFPFLACKLLSLSLKYGNTDSSPYAYLIYGLISCGLLGEIESGYQFGEVGIKLTEKRHIENIRARNTFMSLCFVRHWKDSIWELIPKYVGNFYLGLERGDVIYACYSAATGSQCGFCYGAPLKELLATIETVYEPRVDIFKQKNSSHYVHIAHQAVLNLMRKKEDVDVMIGDAFDESKMIPEFLQINDTVALSFFYVDKLILLFLFEKYDKALDCITYCDRFESGILSMPFIPVLYFYKALTLLVVYDKANKKDKKSIAKKAYSILKKMSKWAEFSPVNHKQRYYLIYALIMWKIKNRSDNAAILFDNAIEAARNNKFLNEEALANELAAKFYLSKNREKVATAYMQESYYCYKIWGANAKVLHIKKNYARFVESAKYSKSDDTIQSTKTTSQTTSNTFEMLTIQKTAQALSNTIQLDELLTKFMHIVMENAGAQNGILLINKNGEFFIEAEASLDKPSSKIMQSVKPTDDLIPLSILNYVMRTKESIVLDDAVSLDKYRNNHYIQKNAAKSILCIPLLNQGKLSGILYLDNNLVKGSFTLDRINILNLLAAHIAISIDNAKLYTDTRILNDRLTKINKAYERFVPRDFLGLLNKQSIMDVQLADHIEDTMTILFADIRDFTTISETMLPEENFKFINSFLSLMVPIIRKYHGVVDKYIGDSIMVIYPERADDAVNCAIEMQNSLQVYNEKAENDDSKIQFNIGIGINTGLLMLGMVGEEHRMNATVISDAVNIASRVESLTKEYHAPILITEATLKKLTNPARYRIEEVDSNLLIRGKTKPIVIYKVTPAKMTII